MTPTQFGARLITLTDQKALERVQHAMGGAGKKAATDAATADLGADLHMSHLRSKAKLAAGYDLIEDGVIVRLRPKGLWSLADRGRRRQGTIRPRKGHRAVRTPQGFRAFSHYTPSRGLHTIEDALKIMEVEVPKAAAKAMVENIGAM